MFKRKNYADVRDENAAHTIPEMGEGAYAEQPEWEEARPDAEASAVAGRQAGSYSAQASGADVDLSEFPAMRMAFGMHTEAHEHSRPHAEEILSEDYYPDEPEDGLSPLIRRYAMLDEAIADTQPEQTAAEQEEDLPLLFAQRNPVEQEKPDENEEAETEDEEEAFSMESEAEKQRAISVELFDFIENIVTDTEKQVSGIGIGKNKNEKKARFDPYNTDFNDRFNDREEVLRSTPEISLKPKYSMDQ